MQIWLCDFVEVDAKHPTVEPEARNAKIVGYRELVEFAPYPRHGLQRERGHDLDLPSSTRWAYALPLWHSLAVTV